MRISEIMHTPAVTCLPTATVGDAARRMCLVLEPPRPAPAF